MENTNQDYNELEISLTNQIICLRDVIVRLLVSFGAIIFLKFDPISILCFGLIYILDAIPAIYLHFEFLIENHGKKIIISHSDIQLYENNSERIINVLEIKKIFIFLSPSLMKNSEFFFFSFEGYHFARIILHTGEEINLTCLLSPRLERSLRNLRGIYIEKKKKNFCSLKDNLLQI